jgi:diamine N-acetyltransferase
VRIHVIHDLAAVAPRPGARGIHVVVSGHSHVPRLLEEEGVLYVNPGSAGPRRFTLPVSVGQLAIEPGRVTARLRELAGVAGAKPARWDGAPRECVMRLDRASSAVRIVPIELPRDAARCVAFRRESYIATFGSAAGMDGEMGTDGATYLDELRRRIVQVPEGNVHLWRGGEIVGQAEMRLVEGDAEVGYVNLFYVVPGERGHGLGRRLHEHAVAVFRARGMRRLRLSVAERNADALAFYRRLGWVRAGRRPHRAPMAVLEFPIPG